MRSVIKQSVILQAPAKILYATYMDPAKHAEVTGAPVTISAASGSEFRAFNGQLSGTMLTAIPSRLVIQSWRSTHFNHYDPDSTLILAFVSEERADASTSCTSTCRPTTTRAWRRAGRRIIGSRGGAIWRGEGGVSPSPA